MLEIDGGDGLAAPGQRRAQHRLRPVLGQVGVGRRAAAGRRGRRRRAVGCAGCTGPARAGAAGRAGPPSSVVTLMSPASASAVAASRRPTSSATTRHPRSAPACWTTSSSSVASSLSRSSSPEIACEALTTASRSSCGGQARRAWVTAECGGGPLPDPAGQLLDLGRRAPRGVAVPRPVEVAVGARRAARSRVRAGGQLGRQRLHVRSRARGQCRWPGRSDRGRRRPGRRAEPARPTPAGSWRRTAPGPLGPLVERRCSAASESSQPRCWSLVPVRCSAVSVSAW